MAGKLRGDRATPSEARRVNDGPGVGAPDTERVLTEARRHVEESQPQKAVEVISRSKLKSAWITNVLGVCQLRLGDGRGAVETFRGLVLKDGIHLREDVPPVYKLNLAASLLAADNLDGFLSPLGEVGDDEHPAARRYREAYRRWRSSLSLGQRLKGFFSGPPSPPPGLGTILGDL